jgi:hypothetical protein
VQININIMVRVLPNNHPDVPGAVRINRAYPVTRRRIPSRFCSELDIAGSKIEYHCHALGHNVPTSSYSRMTPADEVLLRRAYKLFYSEQRNYVRLIETVSHIQDMHTQVYFAYELCHYKEVDNLLMQYGEYGETRGRYRSRQLKIDLEAILYLADLALYRLKKELTKRGELNRATCALMRRLASTCYPNSQARSPFYMEMKRNLYSLIGEEELQYDDLTDRRSPDVW